MKVPGPDHPITVTPNPRRVIVRANGRTLADTKRALTLKEASYPPVHYIPRADVDMKQLERTARKTTCPFKGEASYYSVRADDGLVIENAAWSYENPYDAVVDIEAHVAFYPPLVDSIEELDE